MRYLVLDFYVLSCVWERGGGREQAVPPVRTPQSVSSFLFQFGLIYGGLSWRFVANCGELLTLLCVLIHAFLAFLSWCLTAVLFSYFFSSLQHHGGEDRERGARAGRLQEGHRSSLQRGGERLARVRGS